MKASACLFCQILEKKKSAHIIFENEKVMAFLDIYPSRPGHVLVVPRFHCFRFMQLPGEFCTEMVLVAQRILQRQTDKGFGQGAKIKINDGPDGGQEIPHVHLHLVPQKGLGLGELSLKEIHLRLLEDGPVTL